MEMKPFVLKNIMPTRFKTLEEKFKKTPHAISLAHFIPNFPLPVFLKKSLQNAIENGKTEKYAHITGLSELRECFSEYQKKDHVFWNAQKEISVCNSKKEALFCILLSILQKNDEVLIFAPCQEYWKNITEKANGVPIFLQEQECIEEEVEKHMTPKTKAIILSNPSFPSGKIFSKNELFSLANLASKNNAVLIIDESFASFVHNEEKIFSLAQIPEMKARTWHLFSPTLELGTSGWESCFVASDENNMEKFFATQKEIFSPLSVATQHLLIAAFSSPQSLHTILEHQNAFHRRMKMTKYFLSKFPKIFRSSESKGSFFAFPELLINKTSMEFCESVFENTGILLGPSEIFSDTQKNHVFFSFTKEEKTLQEAFSRLEKFFGKTEQNAYSSSHH